MKLNICKEALVASLSFIFMGSSLHAATLYQGPESAQITKSVSHEQVVVIRTSEKVRSTSQLKQILQSSNQYMRELETADLIFSRPDSAPGLFRTFFTLEVDPYRESAGWQMFVRQSDVIEVFPNYQYEGEARETVEMNDPYFLDQDHHVIMRNDWAWLFSLGSQDVVVAVTDDGVDIDHEDLSENIWINFNEIPDNGIDDDLNGYVDDVYGYDFASKDNDPRPNLSGWGGDHGTHVAGIIAAVSNNRTGLVGVAPKVKIMPIRFYGSGSWTSAMIARAYAYAVDNGARIISTSYNIDGFANDALFEEALDYVYDSGVLHFNSAGNGSMANPRRQKFDQLILVCSTLSDGDQKSSFSNWGEGIDLCAPGSDILSTVPNDRYSAMSGTSMATPAAAGVAALIWSANPGYTRDQVVSVMMSSATSIDSVNPRYENGLGSGRVDAFKAFSIRQSPPIIEEARLVTSRESRDEHLRALELRVHHALRKEDVENPLNWHLQYSGFDGEFGTIDDESIPVSFQGPYRVGQNILRFDIDKSLRFGRFRFYARASLRDPFLRHLDGNRDGVGGDPFVYEFDLDLTR